MKIIAERSLLDEAGNVAVIVRFGAPGPMPDSRFGDFETPFALVVDGVETMHRSGAGTDALSSLYNALESARLKVDALGRKLHWASSRHDAEHGLHLVLREAAESPEAKARLHGAVDREIEAIEAERRARHGAG